MLRRFGSIFVCVLLVVLFAPTQLGGATTYAIITGNSMEPSFKEGDLVLLRLSAVYLLNDIVLYNQPELGPVFHRIVATENNRFILKGDHNTWTDSYHASQQDILGKYWFSVPWLGSVLSLLHTIEGISLTSALAGGLVIGTKVSTQSAKKEKEKKIGKAASAAKLFGVSSISARDAFLLAFASLLILIPIGIYAFASPTYIAASTEYPYQQIGEFSYSSDTPALGIYDQGYLQPGDPIFRRISNSFDLSFSYNLLADGLAESRGTYSLSAIVGETNGWTRTVELIPATPFEGSSLTFSSRISIDDLQAIVDNLEQITGVELSQYNLTIQPRIQILGLMRGTVWQDQFSPSLPFVVNDIEVRLSNNAGEENQFLTQIETDAVTGSTQGLNQLGFLGIKINIQTLRAWLLLLLPTLAAASLVTGMQWLKLYRAGEASRIASIFGPKLVDVNGMVQTSPMKQISVYKIDDLVRIADREASSIFHEKTMDSHYYFVEGRNGIYVYHLEGGLD